MSNETVADRLRQFDENQYVMTTLPSLELFEKQTQTVSEQCSSSAFDPFVQHHPGYHPSE